LVYKQLPALIDTELVIADFINDFDKKQWIINK